MLLFARNSRALLSLLFVLSCVHTAYGVPKSPLGERQTNGAAVPAYVKDYAPILYLHTNEAYFPSDIGAQLTHTTPEINNVAVAGAPYPLTLDNLNALQPLGNSSIYLTSFEGITAFPAWFTGVKPDSTGKVSGASTCAIVTVDKGNGTLDAFYMYFYAYNQGNDVNILSWINLGSFGDHVGDWEHTAIRFINGEPQSIWLSQHSGGETFTYDAMSKYDNGSRPIIYVGNGTHANWATPGEHDHTIPGINLPDQLLLTDYTSAGVLYDPIQSAYFYDYNNATQVFTSYDPGYPVNWLYYTGQWGDAQLPSSTPGQEILFGQAKYAGGPNGPIMKNLGRKNICNSAPSVLCVPLPVLTS